MGQILMAASKSTYSAEIESAIQKETLRIMLCRSTGLMAALVCLGAPPTLVALGYISGVVGIICYVFLGWFVPGILTFVIAKLSWSRHHWATEFIGYYLVGLDIAALCTFSLMTGSGTLLLASYYQHFGRAEESNSLINYVRTTTMMSPLIPRFIKKTIEAGAILTAFDAGEYKLVLNDTPQIAVAVQDMHEKEPNKMTDACRRMLLAMLARCLYLAGDPKLGKNIWAQVVDLPPLPPDTTLTDTSYACNELAASATIFGDYQRAVHYGLRSLSAHNESSSDSKTVTIEIHISLANAYLRVGNIDKAKEHATVALATCQYFLPDSALSTARARLSIGRIELVDGKLDAAQTTLREVLDVFRARNLPDHPNLIEPILALSECLEQAGKSAEALTLRKEANRIANNHKIQPDEPIMKPVTTEVAKAD